MNFYEMKAEAQKIANKYRNQMRRTGSKFITSEAPLLAFDDDGRLEGKAYISYAHGDSGESVSQLKKGDFEKAIEQVTEEAAKNPKIDSNVGISLYGTHRGYENIRAYKNDEYYIDDVTFDITIWTLKDGIVCRDENE